MGSLARMKLVRKLQRKRAILPSSEQNRNLSKPNKSCCWILGLMLAMLFLKKKATKTLMILSSSKMS